MPLRGREKNGCALYYKCRCRRMAASPFEAYKPTCLLPTHLWLARHAVPHVEAAIRHTSDDHQAHSEWSITVIQRAADWDFPRIPGRKLPPSLRGSITSPTRTRARYLYAALKTSLTAHIVGSKLYSIFSLKKQLDKAWQDQRIRGGVQ